MSKKPASNEELQSRIEDLTAQLSAEKQRTSALRREYFRLEQDFKKALRHFDLLHNDTKALFNSLTWKVGSISAELFRRVLLRPRVPLVRDHIDMVVESYTLWRKPNRDNRPDDAHPVLAELLHGSELRSDHALLDYAEPGDRPYRLGALVGRRGNLTLSGSAHIRVALPFSSKGVAQRVNLELLYSPTELDHGLDAVLIQRNALPDVEQAEQAVAYAQALGAAILFEIDDDLFAPDFKMRSSFPKSVQDAMSHVITQADLVICSTEPLAKRLEDLNERTVVVPNRLASDLWLGQGTPAYERQDESPLRVLYMGTRTHEEDLALIKDAWKKIKKKYGDSVELDIVGGIPEGTKTFGNTVKIDPLPDASHDSYPEFARWLTQNNRWHVGLAPLCDTEFNRAKSSVKFLDYAALGLAVVASDLEPYRKTLTHRHTGLLAQGTTESWFEALDALLSDRELRAELGRNAREELIEQHTLEGQSLEYIRVLSDAVERTRQWRQIAQLPFDSSVYLEQNPDVGEAINAGSFSGAHEHWQTLGADEVRRGARHYHPRMGPVSMGLRYVDTDAVNAARPNATKAIEDWRSQPKISVVMPVYDVEIEWLQAALDSVAQQLYGEWELCICNDASPSEAVNRLLAELDHPQIKLVRHEKSQGIAAATNSALQLATGDHVTFMDHDDELSADALFQLARVIVDQDPDLIYSDEAKLELDGTRCDPHYKPDFSRELIQSQNYISHLTLMRRSWVADLGGLASGVDGSQDHDLLLRYLQRARSVVHIPLVLYYWRKVPQSTAARFDTKDYAWDAGVEALNRIYRDNDAVHAEKGQYPGTYRVRRNIKDKPLVSIIIPFRDEPELLEQCLASVLGKTTYDHLEVIGVDNQSADPRTHETMRSWCSRDSRVSFVSFDDAFNYAAINNFAAQRARGDHLLLLNNDITVIEPDWLTSLLEFSQLDDVGAVGGMLCYPDNTIQHAGVVLGIGGVAGHSHKYLPDTFHGYFSRPHLIQNVSAVTGACLMVKASVYAQSGGLNDRDLTVAFNDIDFCLRLRELGYQNVYTPYCKLYHHESKSRGSEDTPQKQERFRAETLYMKQRHALALAKGDPFYSPNLTLEHEDFRVRQ